MTAYSRLQPLALTLGDAIPEQHGAVAARPPDWKERLAPYRRPHERSRGLPIQSLLAGLRTLVPGVLAINAGARPGDGWIFASAPVPEPVLRALLLVWLGTAFDGIPGTRRETLAAELALQWRPACVAVDDWEVAENGTTRPGAPEVPVLLVHRVAELLSRPEDGYEFGSFGRRPLFRVAAVDNPWTAELQTWPPFEVPQRSGPAALFSISVGVSVQTRPFEPRPQVHLALRVRRWVTWTPRVTEHPSVYIRSDLAWLDDTTASPWFHRPQLGWQDGPAWHDGLGRMLENLHLLHRFPSAARLVEDPCGHLGEDREVQAAIVHGTRLGDHRVGAGLFPLDHARLVEQLLARLEPDLALVAPYLRLPRLGRSLAALGTGSLHARLHAAVAASPRVEILHQTTAAAEAVPRALARVLEGSLSDRTLVCGPVSIRLETEPLGALGAGLTPSDGAAARVSAVAARLTAADGTAGALIELPGADEFPVGADPKWTLRRAAARVGWVTQFVRPPEMQDGALGAADATLLGHRLDSAARDLVLRQFGVPPERLPAPAGIRDVRWLGLWLHARGRLPVLVEITREAVRGTCLGLPGWMPFPRLLTALPELAVRVQSRPGEPLAWIEDKLRRLAGLPVALFVGAINARGVWAWLRNEQIAIDRMELASGRVIPADLPGLRLIRVRVPEDSRQETPRVYATDQSRAGLATGLWDLTGHPRVAGSTAPRPRTAKHVRADASRYGWALPFNAWNPSLVEFLAPFLQPGDRPLDWLWAAHWLRLDPHAHHGDATLFPDPLHLARGAKEYLPPD